MDFIAAVLVTDKARSTAERALRTAKSHGMVAPPHCHQLCLLRSLRAFSGLTVQKQSPMFRHRPRAVSREASTTTPTATVATATATASAAAVLLLLQYA